MHEGWDVFYAGLCLLDKLHSGTHHGAVGCEFSDIKWVSLNRKCYYVLITFFLKET